LGALSRRQFLLASLATSALLLGDRAFGAAEDLTRLSLQEASNSVRGRSVSPLELTQAYLSRIEKLNPSLNAYITVTAEQALSRARELETEQTARPLAWAAPWYSYRLKGSHRYSRDQNDRGERGVCRAHPH
jgi:Amidase